ncbi:MAG: hypothetical protein OHK0029_02410 [Armatimonadaceae bacterium]
MEEDDRMVDDRTVELRAPSGTVPPQNPANASHAQTKTPQPKPAVDGLEDRTVMQRVDPIFPNAGALEDRLPEGVVSQRPSPALDPIARGNVARIAKWGLLAGILFAVLWLAAALFSQRIAQAAVEQGVDVFRAQSPSYFLALALAVTTLGTVVATGLPRLVLSNVFGKWTDASEAFRDWLVVALLNGLLFAGLLAVGNMVRSDWALLGVGSWLPYRIPLLVVTTIISFLVGRALAIRQESIISEGTGSAVWQTALQVVLVAILVPVFDQLVRPLSAVPVMQFVFGTLAVVCLAGSLGTITWAASADANLMALRGRGRSGVDDGGPMDMTLTVIGGRESGKTVLLAAAFYEWSTKGIGNLRISPSEEAMQSDTRSEVSNLEMVAKELYVDNQFPVGTVSTQNLPFDLWMGEERVAKFTFLDYPGGAIAGNVANKKFVEQFYERVEDTDGIVLIADMSYVRRASKEQDWLDVRNAYREVMRRIMARNGKRRVIPVALVLTKCDEFVDPNTGHIDMSSLEAGFEDFEYHTLQSEWVELSKGQGPGFAEFSTWMTSAITYSEPQRDRNGLPDYTKPFMIAPPPPPIKPTGCASPLLWMCAKVMRWNYTLFSDIRRFVMGSSPQVRRRAEAILEMERVAEDRRGRGQS